MNLADLERVARAHGIRLLLQFGSTVTGRTHAKSDVDVAVLLERPDQTLDERATMAHDLQAVFHDRELDLAVLNHADPLFLKQVMDTARRLYGRRGSAPSPAPGVQALPGPPEVSRAGAPLRFRRAPWSGRPWLIATWSPASSR